MGAEKARLQQGRISRPVGAHTKGMVIWTQPVGLGWCARERTRIEVQILSRHTLSGLEAEGNCVAARRGGEQSEARDQSAGVQTRFGLTFPASLPAKGEAWTP